MWIVSWTVFGVIAGADRAWVEFYIGQAPIELASHRFSAADALLLGSG